MTPAARDRPAVATWWWWPPAGGVLFALAYPPLDLLPLAILGLWPLFAFLDREAADRPRTAFVGGYLIHQVLKINLGLGSPFVDQVAIATIGAVVVTVLARVVAR